MMGDKKKMAAAIVAKMKPAEEREETPEPEEGLLFAAQDILDVMSTGYSPSVCESDNPVERASKEAARRAKAKMLADALRSFIEQC
jgi:hypothetical protein